MRVGRIGIKVVGGARGHADARLGESDQFVRMIGTPSNWPPSYLDEIASLLINVPYPHLRPSQRRDSDYGLVVALAELSESLDVEPIDKKGEGDRRSLVADVTRALEQLGPFTRARVPTAAGIQAALNAFASSGDEASRNLAVALVAQLRAELADTGAWVEAFDDLLATAQDPDASHDAVRARLDVLTGVLELGDRSAGEVCRLLGGIVDDQALEISYARHDVYGSPVREPGRVDEPAGLADDERLDLCRLYLQTAAPPGHHVVWVAYGDAQIGPGDWRARVEDWRARVGPVEFFDGPTLVRAIQESANGSRDGSVPEELFQALEGPGLDRGFWPDVEDVRHWVAVRVDLGVVPISNPIATGRAQAEAVVQLAVFENQGSTWFPLEGVLHIADDRLRSSEAFHVLDSFHDLRVERDATARELTEVAAAVGTRLPVVDPSLRRLLREVRALNASSQSPDPELLLNDFRVIEFVTRRNNHRDWEGFLKDNLATFRVHNQILDEIYQSVSAVLRAFPFSNQQELEDQIREQLPDGMVLMKRKAALDLIPQLVPQLPIHHQAARRLRGVALRTQDLASLQEWVDELTADYKIKIDRAARVRNGLIHGGAASLDAASTIRVLVNGEARVIAKSTLEAILEGKPIKQAFDGYRIRNRDWKRRIPTAKDVTDALFDERQ